MNEPPTWLTDLENEAGNKPVLLVEGDIDQTILAHFLAQVTLNWETGLVMLPAGAKRRVIRAVRAYHPEWAGIVDTDEWTPAEIEQALKDVPRVKALPRFCLESYFCLPEEIGRTLPANRQATVSVDDLAGPIEAKLPDWVAHGAMWRVLRRRRTALLYDAKFPAKLDRVPLPDKAEIRRILAAWHAQLEPDQILAAYEVERQAAKRQSRDEQLTTYIHGKKFFRQVVVETLNRRLHRREGADTWREKLARTMPIPDDLKEFLAEILAMFP